MVSFESFNGKSSVIVTGAGRGIGRAIATKLYSLGATVYAVSNDPDNLATLKSECPSIKVIIVDLADWDATRAALKDLPTIDHVVNCAGVASAATFEDTTAEILDRTYNVNFRAVVNVSQIFVKKLIADGKAGSIVNFSSIASKISVPPAFAYSTLKAGLDHLTRNMAAELAPLNIRVNAINPGRVLTPMLIEGAKEQLQKYGDRYKTADILKRAPSPNKTVDMKHIVNTVLFLLSDAAVALTGNTVTVDGGLGIA